MGRISNYISTIAKSGGMALSTGYVVKFTLAPDLQKYIDSMELDIDLYEGFCDEANLPPSQAATAQITGRYLGEGAVSYPHTKMYTDVSLSWMCDANMEPYKFAQGWWQYIFGEHNDAGDLHDKDTYYPSYNNVTTLLSTGNAEKLTNRETRLRYPEQYMSQIVIAKAEKGGGSPTDRMSTAHVLQDAYPYSVDSIPLSFGSSQLVKVTANFYYSKHYVRYNNLKQVSNAVGNQLLSQENIKAGDTLGSSNIA